MNCNIDLSSLLNSSWMSLRNMLTVIIQGVTKKQKRRIILLLNFTTLLLKRLDWLTVDSLCTAFDVRIVWIWSKIIKPTTIASITFLTCEIKTALLVIKLKLIITVWDKAKRHATHIKVETTFIVHIVVKLA